MDDLSLLWNRVRPEKQDTIKQRLLDQGITPQVSDLFLPCVQESVDEDASYFVESLLKERYLRASDVSLMTGLSAPYIREIIKGKSRISKEYILALSLFFRLSIKETEDFHIMCGKPFYNTVPDIVFKMYVKSGKHDVSAWVRECRQLANDLKVELPPFYYKEIFDIYRKSYK